MPDQEIAAYQRLPTWVLGFHGCDESVGMDVLTNKSKHLELSENAYDWLGSGIYFWENDPERAMQFATEGMDGKVTKLTFRRSADAFARNFLTAKDGV